MLLLLLLCMYVRCMYICVYYTRSRLIHVRQYGKRELERYCRYVLIGQLPRKYHVGRKHVGPYRLAGLAGR
ncbi:hypothetical protein F4815DRAFT_476330 [Daldinia loculata]|nr:hypothetical protein F4815DRAFT_476330 [Daldinia loculata]